MARSLNVSEKRLLGWEPKVTTRGFDRTGAQVPLAEAWEWVAETEPEWDDLQRDRMTGFVMFERGVHNCGFHLSLTSDKANHFAVEESECLLCANMDRFDRVRADADKRALAQVGGDNAPAAVPRPADGRVTSVRMKPSPAALALMQSASESD